MIAGLLKRRSESEQAPYGGSSVLGPVAPDEALLSARRYRAERRSALVAAWRYWQSLLRVLRHHSRVK